MPQSDIRFPSDQAENSGLRLAAENEDEEDAPLGTAPTLLPL